jgi:hypothetical protein
MPKKYPKGTTVRIYNRDPKSNATVLYPELEKYHDQIGKVVNVKDLGMVWEERHSRPGQALGGEPTEGPYRSVYVYVVRLDNGENIEVTDDRCLQPVD